MWTSPAQNNDLATTVDNRSDASLKNTTNNTGMLAMSQRSADEFERSGTSVSGAIVLSAQKLAVGELGAVESGVTSCQLIDSQQLSTSSPVSKVNLTNNALLAVLSKQSVQQSRQSMTSPLSQKLSFPTMFPAQPDSVMIDQLAATVATPEPMFRTPVPAEPQNIDTAEPAKLPDKPKDLSDTFGVSQTLKPAKMETDVSRDAQDTRTYATDNSEKTSAVRERSRPQSPPSGKQTQNNPTIPTKRDPSSSVSRTAKRSDVTEEAAKTNRKEIDLPLDAFTLRKTVKLLLDKDKETSGPASNKTHVKMVVVPPRSKDTPGDDEHAALDAKSKQSEAAAKTNREEITLPLDAFTLRKTVKLLLENERETSGPASKKTHVKMAVIPSGSKNTPGDYEHTASDAKSKKSSASATVESQATKEAAKITSLNKTSAVSQNANGTKSGLLQSSASQNKQGTKAKHSTTADNVLPDTEDKLRVIRVAVEPPDESKNRENGVNAKAKKKMRFVLIEDHPSPTNPGDHQIPSPLPSTHRQLNAYESLELMDQHSVTSSSDPLSPSPLPSERLPIELDSEAMISLRRLFPMINDLVRVTLVPPRRHFSRRLDSSDEVLSMSSLSDVEEESESTGHSGPEDMLSPRNIEEQMELVEETNEELGLPEAVLFNRDVAVTKQSTTNEKSFAGVVDRSSALPTAQSEQKPSYDVMSVNQSLSSASTALPLDVISNQPSDEQLNATKILMMQKPRRILPPNKADAEQSQSEKVQVDVGGDVNGTSDVVDKRLTKKESTDVDEVASQHNSVSDAASEDIITAHRPDLRGKKGPVLQLGIASHDVEELVWRSSHSSTESLHGDVADRATTMASGAVQSLRATTSIVGH